MGIRETFLDAYDRYADAIYRHCYFRVFSRARAEELMQETFLRAWQYLASGENVHTMRAFLYRVANNLIIDESRKRKEMSLDAMQEEGSLKEPTEDGAEALEQGVLVKEVLEELRALDRDERTIILMRYVDEFEPREIAEVTGMSVNVVSVKLHRALKKVRRHMQT